MRRQTQSQGLAARWQPVPLDVNPFQLPARFNLSVESSTGTALTDWDHIIVRQGSITIERHVPGVGYCREEHAIETFSGVAIRIDTTDGTPEGFVVSVNLHHDDPELCIPLHMAFDMNDASAHWQSWSRILGLPLLLAASDGSWREPIERLGKLAVNDAYMRNPRMGLKRRRSLVSSTRRNAAAQNRPPVHSREIIARD